MLRSTVLAGMISHAVVLAVTAELPMLNAIADEVVAIRTLSVAIGPIRKLPAAGVCIYDAMILPLIFYNLPTATSMTPDVPSKFSRDLPITVPINGVVVGLANPSPALTNISPLRMLPRTLQGTLPCKASCMMYSPAHIEFITYAGLVETMPATLLVASAARVTSFAPPNSNTVPAS